MSMQDPISNMLTTIRNGCLSYKKFVYVIHSKIILNILKILKNEGFILNFFIKKININKKIIYIKLKYKNNLSSISKIERISKPSLRVYSNKNIENKKFINLGVLILSTSKGLMTSKESKKLGIGGELICYIL